MQLLTYGITPIKDSPYPYSKVSTKIINSISKSKEEKSLISLVKNKPNEEKNNN